MMRAAIACDDPVVYLEHKDIWALEGPVDEAEFYAFGKARQRHSGDDLTIVSWSNTANLAAQAATDLAQSGIHSDVLDLRSLWPWDKPAVLESVRRTGRLLIAHESVQVGGFGAEVAATVAEHAPCQMKRLGAPRSLIAYAPNLEDQLRVTADMILDAARTMCA